MSGSIHRTTDTPKSDGGSARSRRLVVCVVPGSRSKATVPAHLLKGRNRELFFRHLLRLDDSQRVVIREVAG